jgi:hypothetical protein
MMNLDDGHLVDTQSPIGVEIALLDAPILEGDLAVKRGGETVDDGALHLRLDGVGIDDDAAVDRASDALDGDIAVHGDPPPRSRQYARDLQKAARLADAACDGVALRQGMTIDNSTPTLGLRRVSAGDALLKRHGLPGVITTCLQAPRRVCAS